MMPMMPSLPFHDTWGRLLLLHYRNLHVPEPEQDRKSHPSLLSKSQPRPIVPKYLSKQANLVNFANYFTRGPCREVMGASSIRAKAEPSRTRQRGLQALPSFSQASISAL